MTFGICLNIVIIVAGIVAFVCMHADKRHPCYSSIALSVMVWSVHAKHAANATLVQTLVYIKSSAIYKEYLTAI